MVLWMVMGPVILILLFLTGLAILLLTPVFLIYTVISGLLFLRTRNTGYLVKGLLFLFLTLFTLTVFFLGNHVFTLVTGAFSALLLIWLLALVLVKDFKWRNLQVLELAAQPVDEVREGYSMRPMPAGNLRYNWDELLGFAGYVRRNLVADVYFENDKVAFSLNRDRFKMITFSRDYLNGTWVAFDRQGHVSVHLSREDHAQFRESYAFDQLCNSLGSVFSGFFELYRQGREQEVVRSLDSVQL